MLMDTFVLAASFDDIAHHNRCRCDGLIGYMYPAARFFVQSIRPNGPEPSGGSGKHLESSGDILWRHLEPSGGIWNHMLASEGISGTWGSLGDASNYSRHWACHSTVAVHSRWSVHPYNRTFVRPSVRASVRPSVRPSVHPSIHPTV